MSTAQSEPQLSEQESAKIDQLATRIARLPKQTGRHLICVAGAPASGKSTMTEILADRVIALGRPAKVIPMDGFHLDNRILDARGLRSRKGAPETFDAHGFIALMHRIKSGGEVIYPVFDRSRDMAIAGAELIEAECDVAIVEGNYLLFGEEPWSTLADIWDIAIRVDVPEDVLLARLVQRWIDHDHTPEQALARAEGNDMPNARRIITKALPADELICS